MPTYGDSVQAQSSVPLISRTRSFLPNIYILPVSEKRDTKGNEFIGKRYQSTTKQQYHTTTLESITTPCDNMVSSPKKRIHKGFRGLCVDPPFASLLLPFIAICFFSSIDRDPVKRVRVYMPFVLLYQLTNRILDQKKQRCRLSWGLFVCLFPGEQQNKRNGEYEGNEGTRQKW